MHHKLMFSAVRISTVGIRICLLKQFRTIARGCYAEEVEAAADTKNLLMSHPSSVEITFRVVVDCIQNLKNAKKYDLV